MVEKMKNLRVASVTRAELSLVEEIIVFTMDTLREAIEYLELERDLGMVMAVSGCTQIRTGTAIDVFARNGDVVFSGDFADFQMDMSNNLVIHGEPIVHRSVVCFDDAGLEECRRRSRVLGNIKRVSARKIQKLRDIADELEEEEEEEVLPPVVEEEAGDSDFPDGVVISTMAASVEATREVARQGDGVEAGSEAENLDPEVDRGVGSLDGVIYSIPQRGKCRALVTPATGREVLCGDDSMVVPPEDNVKRLQEAYEALGYRPEYDMTAGFTGGFLCCVRVACLEARGEGSTQEEAMQDAAATLLGGMRDEGFTVEKLTLQDWPGRRRARALHSFGRTEKDLEDMLDRVAEARVRLNRGSELAGSLPAAALKQLAGVALNARNRWSFYEGFDSEDLRVLQLTVHDDVVQAVARMRGSSTPTQADEPQEDACADMEEVDTILNEAQQEQDGHLDMEKANAALDVGMVGLIGLVADKN